MWISFIDLGTAAYEVLFRKLEKEVNYNKNKPEQKVFSKKDLLLIFQVHDHRSTLL